MKRLINKLIHKTVPRRILKFFFPDEIRHRFNSFIQVRDSIADRNFKLWIREDSFMEKVIFEKGLYGGWEKESLKIWAHLCHRSAVILDIGANTGIFSLLAYNNNPSANIIAVEPIDINYNVLRQNIDRNGAGIKTEKLALSDQAGTAKMFMLKDRLNYMTSVNDDRYKDAPHVRGDFEVVEIEVPIQPFSYIAQKYNLEQLDLIKLDVEGHELDVLKTMLPYLEQYKPSVLIEVIGHDNALALNDLFARMGYVFISIDEENTSKVVERLWDNDHHNFLLCTKETITYLQSKKMLTV